MSCNTNHHSIVIFSSFLPIFHLEILSWSKYQFNGRRSTKIKFITAKYCFDFSIQFNGFGSMAYDTMVSIEDTNCFV